MSLSLICLAVSVNGQTPPGQELRFKPEHRAIAHGNEFNALALSADERRLFIGAETGEIIVWNILEQRIERKLIQGKPVHNIVALADPKFIVASGEEHLGENIKTTVRKWNVETAAFEDMPGLDDVPVVLALSVEPIKGLVAVAGINGKVMVWDTVSNKVIASWELEQVPVALCLLGKQVLVSIVDAQSLAGEEDPTESRFIVLNIATPRIGPKDFIKASARFWTDLKVSPDGKTISAISSSSNGERLTLFNSVKKSEGATINARSMVWINDKKFLTFNGFDPSEIVQVSLAGNAKTVQTFAHKDWNLSGPREFDLSGQVVLKDGSRAWSIYRKGSGFYEWDLKAKTANRLMEVRTGAYSLSVLPQAGQSGLVLTGGADGFVRLWNFADLSLLREFHIGSADALVSNAELFPDGRRAIVATNDFKWHEDAITSATDITLVNLETGEQKKLLTSNQPRTRVMLIDSDVLYSSGNRIVLASAETAAQKREFVADGFISSFAISSNKRWLLTVEDSNAFCVFEIETGRRVASQRAEETAQGVPEPRPQAITNDGRYVYSIGSEGNLTRWDATTNQTTKMVLQKLRQVHSRVDYLTLAENDTLIVTPGNHGDVGVYDSQTGELISYTRTPAAVFWTEKAWLSENRLIFTTDTGVMYSGTLVNVPND